MFQDTGIILFSRSAKEEAKFKSLHRHDARNKIVLNKLREHSLKIVERSKIDYIIYDEKNQHGFQFSDKLTNAINEAFSKYDKLIVLGADCPELAVSDIKRAALALQQSNQVLGLEKKGGAYLIGLQKSNWNPVLFERLAWTTKNLGEQLYDLLNSCSSVAILDTKSDINRSVDLLANFIQAEAKKLIAIIKSILFDRQNLIGQSKKLDFNFIQNSISFRGPPALMS